MYRIKEITLENFKFFYDKVSIDFGSKNILLYGENGSGKSSLYWSLYTFLQSAFKHDDAEISKYFNQRHDENLINRYASDDAESSISVIYENTGVEPSTFTTRIISLTNITTKTDKLVEETTLASDFIDHKVLSRIYAYYHKEKIDLFNFFHHELFSFINFRIELNGSKNAETWWSYFQNGISPKPKMNEPIYKDFQANLMKFNEELNYYLTNIQQLANEHLEKRFEEKFRIKLEYRNATYNDFKPDTKGRSWKMKLPQIVLSVELVTPLITNPAKKIVDSPQSFLNEAKLSIIALAMRLAILDEKFVHDYPKVLVLDDMLMSMDMSNREFILGILLENYLPDYQILFFTHQRGLFEDARIFIENHYAEKARISGVTDRKKQKEAWKDSWKLIEMYEVENGRDIPIPYITEYESNIQKSLKYFKEQIDYNACGNNLRMVLEEFFRNHLPHKYFVNETGNPISAKSLMLDALLTKAREYFTYVGFDITPLDKLDRYRVRSLNPTSHYNPKTDYFKRELKEIFSILQLLKGNRNEALLCKDHKIKFDIQTTSGKTYSYTAILLDDICFYQKNDGSASFFIDIDERGYALEKCVEGANETIFNPQQQVKGTLQKIYNETIEYINKTETAIIEIDMYSIFKNENGICLNDLKRY